MFDMSDTSEKVSKLEARILRNRQQIKRLKESERKQQTRLKIELGGLVFTAELHPCLPDLSNRDGEARSIILGILADAAERLNDPQYRDLKSTRLNSSHVSESRMPSSA